MTGSDVAVDHFQQLFLLAASQGRKQPREWAEFAWYLLSAQGQKLVKGGATIEAAEENLAELVAKAQAFSEKQLPILKALQLV